jgi:XTP/dITP diphosphohydrolase
LTKKKLLLATTNPGKIKELKSHLTGLSFQILSLQDLDLNTVYSETGHTFMENARGKGLFYSQYCEDLTLAEDSGLVIDHLNGAPGVFSSRFAGPEATDEENLQKALVLLEGLPREKRNARFVSCMVLCEKGTIIKEIEENVEGFITTKKRGSAGFGYDPIFFYPPLNKTFAELMPEEKNVVSHRGRALTRLGSFLREYPK